MIDEMLQITQRWLNSEYSGKSGYTTVPEDGGDAADSRFLTYQGLIRALQIELKDITVDGTFGAGTVERFDKVYPTGVGEVDNPDNAESVNISFIIQGTLWCKGYGPGGFTGIFGPKTASAIRNFQSDAGIAQTGIVSGFLLQGLMNTDGYEITSIHGYQSYRKVQRKINELYWGKIGLTATDGIWERKSHKNLIKACQIEWGVTADGVFGNGAYNAAPTLSKNKSGWTASKRLLQCALIVNGFYIGEIDGIYGEDTYNAVYNFQSFLCLGADGIAGKNTWASLLKSCGYSGRSTTACDTAKQLTAGEAVALKTKGYDTVGRYLTKVSKPKELNAEEVTNLANAALKVFPIFQTSGDHASYFTVAQGNGDAVTASEAAAKIGFPRNTVIYFAVDYDVRTTEIPALKKYFEAVAANIKEYRVGIYGPRSICSTVVSAGIAVNCFVADMSSGFEGNIGYRMPDGWAYQQIAEVTESGIGIDKVVASPRATAVLASELRPHSIKPDDPGDYPKKIPEIIGYDNRDMNPQVLINRGGSSIPVYAEKLVGGGDLPNIAHSYHAGGEVIGNIQPNEFYTRYHTGYADQFVNNQWISDGDCVHLVLFRDSDGYIRFGYIQEDFTVYNVKESALPYQEAFLAYNYNPINDALENQYVTPDPDDPTGAMYSFDVKQPLKYYSIGGLYSGTIPTGSVLVAGRNTSSIGGVTQPWCGMFSAYFPPEETTAVSIDPNNPYGTTNGWVELGYQYGTIGNSRALF